MERRAFLGGLVCTLATGCSALGKVSQFGGSFSTRGSAKASSTSSATTLARSYRLDPGFFFGHDVRPFQSVTYVLDLSGSMSERTGSVLGQMGRESASSAVASFGGSLGAATAGSLLSMDKKVELVKDHLNASLRGLSTGAEFNIVLFSGDVQKLAPGMMRANAATTALVSAFVARLEEGGGTSMRSAIEADLATGAEDIMVLTDGLPTDATPQEILTMVDGQNAAKTHRIFTVGVGDDQAEDFLTKLAEDNGGKYLAYK